MKFEVRISEAVLRKVALHRLFRGWKGTAVVLLVIAIMVQQDWNDGSLGAVSIFCLSAAGILLLMYAAVYIRDMRSIADWKRLQGDEPIRYELSPETVRATSKLGSTEVRWEVFKELLLDDDYMLFSMGRVGQLTLPRREVPKEAVEFIYEQLSLRHRPVKKAWA